MIEDLHWIDEASDAMLAGWSSRSRARGRWRWSTTGPNTSPPGAARRLTGAIPLTPLGRADTAELLRDLAGADPSLDGLDEPIHERTQGNPFFIEEIVRELAESGHLEGERGAYRLVAPIEDARVPVTVQAILAARIDRLAPESKQLLQAASVVGKEVSSRALGLTAGLEPERIERRARELIEAGFLYEAELYPQRVLAFRHPLTREVAYGTQLAERRARDPRRRGAGDDRARAGAPRRARGARRPPHGRGRRDAGSGALVRAGRALGRPQPAARRAPPLAAGDRAERQLEESEETLALAKLSRMLQLEYAWRLGMDPAEAAALAAEATAIAERSGDTPALALLKLLTGARPGVAESAAEWVGRRPRRPSSPTAPATRRCGSPSAAPPPTPRSAPATSTGSKPWSTSCSS